MVMSFVLLQIFSVTLISVTRSENCFRNSDHEQCNFGVHTPYRFIANYNESKFVYPGCTEKKIWMMVRHGTRNPGRKFVEPMTKHLPEIQSKIIENFEIGNGHLSSIVVEKLRKWKISLKEDDAMKLVDEGENELIDLAERMQARFPTILKEDYDEKSFKFKYTNTSRTELSARSFTLGLFGQSDSSKILFPKPRDDDPVLRFYKRCPRWLKYKKGSEVLKERDLFNQSQVVQNVVSDISEKIGFKINLDDAWLMYLMCAFETAWTPNIRSPWCDLFTLKDLKVLEFMDELKYYWTDGYGYQLNYEQACPALKDMFQFFDSPGEPIVTTYFSHSGTILKMLSILGIVKDDKPLTSDSFSLEKNSRKWRTALIDSFASNIAFVLYECEKQGSSILVLHQERPIRIPGCPSEVPCPMKMMKDNLPDSEQECPFDHMCAINSS
ncbi:hypothetical protein QAD02_015143 [Eretmocerus hayati]|uniref:Uncharacterized protein n=1 Tax=Eretmocerus hayati TaxID=131215 RepID=A0ACC2P7E7_9HYME|nr:hypothetical protein QAD02_015143 [Eretmocerus hayati]